MFKKIYLLLFMSVLFQNVNLQAQKIKTTKLTHWYFVPPKIKLPDNVKTYSTHIELPAYGGSKFPIITLKSTGETVRDKACYKPIDMKNKYEERYLKFFKYQKTNSNPDLDVYLTFTFPKIKRVKNRQRKYDGKVTGSGYDFQYWFRCHLDIDDKAGNTIISKDIRPNSETGNATFWESDKKLLSNTRDEYLVVGDIESQSCFRGAALILHDLDFIPQEMKIHIASAKSDKKRNYDDLIQANGLMTAIIEESLPDNRDNYELICKSSLETLDKTIKIWETAISEADINNKKSRINKNLVYKLNLNLAYAYFLKLDFQKAIENVQKAGNDKSIKKETKSLLETIVLIKKRYALK